MTNTTINYINIDGIKTDINKNITSYNTTEEFEGYKITSIEYEDYLIIFSEDEHVTTININSIDYFFVLRRVEYCGKILISDFFANGLIIVIKS